MADALWTYVRGLAGAHTYARTATALVENIYEVIALVNDDSSDEHPTLRVHFVDGRAAD